MSFTIPFNTSSIIKFTQPITAIVGILIVTGGAPTSIATSFSNGATWDSSSNIFTKGRDIATNNTIFLAVGEGTNTIATSTDGNTWNGQGTSDFSTAGHKAIWDGSKWILAGQGTNTLLYGTTGTSWTGVVSSPFTTAAYGLLYDSAAGKYFAVGSGTNHTLATSTNGISWTGAGNNFVSGNAYTIHGPAASTAADPGNAWIAVGNTGTSVGNIIMANTTVASWTRTTISHSNRYAIGYGNGIWISGGLGGTGVNNYSISTDGGAGWTQYSLGANSGHVFTAKYANGIWLMGGWGNSLNHIQRSLDNGSTWATCNANTAAGLTSKIFNNDCWTIEYGNGIWMAGGDVNNTTIVTSTDNGNLWSPSDSGFTNIYSIAYGNGYWVAAGSGGIRYSSNNGGSWSTGLTLTNRRAVAYGNGRWVCLGTDPNYPILYTSDPTSTSWTAPTSGSGGLTGKTTEMGLATNGGNTWLGCIDGQVIKSVDNGTTWGNSTSSLSVARQVAFRGNKKPKYVVGGTGKYLMMGSDDGTTWYEITDQPFSVAVNDVKWNGSIWLAGGEGYWKLAYSNNGSNWIGINQTVFTTRVNKVHWNSRLSKWYAVGEGTSKLAISGINDVLSWTAITTPIDNAGIGILST